MPQTKFHIREVDSAKGDVQFILDAFDTALPHLAAIGSAGQWGTTPFSHTTARIETVRGRVEEAEAYRRTGEGKLVEMLVAEVDVGDESFGHVEKGARMPVAMVTVKEDWWPEYVSGDKHLAPKIAGEKNWMYVHILISDYRAGEWRKGAGSALMAEVKERTKARGFERIWVDCWAGNERKLVA